jgi:hypothetical protein
LFSPNSVDEHVLSDVAVLVISVPHFSYTSIIRLDIVLLLQNSVKKASWLWHCATSRQVAGSIPDGVTGIFH